MDDEITDSTTIEELIARHQREVVRPEFRRHELAVTRQMFPLAKNDPEQHRSVPSSAVPRPVEARWWGSGQVAAWAGAIAREVDRSSKKRKLTAAAAALGLALLALLPSWVSSAKVQTGKGAVSPEPAVVLSGAAFSSKKPATKVVGDSPKRVPQAPSSSVEPDRVKPGGDVAQPIASSSPNGRTLERQAIDAVVAGNAVDALARYRELAEQHPESAAFRKAVQALANRKAAP